MKKIKVGIVGGAGYTGGELIRLLLNHPQAEIVFVNSKSNADKYLYEVHRDLVGETDQKFSSELSEDIDVLFLCVGHGEARKFLEANQLLVQVYGYEVTLSKEKLFGDTRIAINLKYDPIVGYLSTDNNIDDQFD